MVQSISRYLHHQFFGERTEDTFSDKIGCVDLVPFTLKKGTPAQLREQCEELAMKLGLESVYELFAISFNLMVMHALLHVVKYGEPMPVLVATSYAAKYIFGEVGLGRFENSRHSPLMMVCFGLHPQGIMMGMNKSKIFDTVRPAMNASIVDCYRGAVGITDPNWQTNIMDVFGNDWI